MGWRGTKARVKNALFWSRYTFEVLRKLRGEHPRHCPICDYRGRFRAFGSPPRYDAWCPGCGSLERHRLFMLAQQRFGMVEPGGDLLHIGPEPVLAGYFRPRCRRYVTLDRYIPGVDLNEPVEHMSAVDRSYSYVFACHVLEHVDDRAALREIFRVLRPGGVLFAMVPIVEGWADTYEREDVESEAGRWLHFGQGDHVRIYGRDFRQRLVDAGFAVAEVVADGADVINHGLCRGETVFVCQRPAVSGEEQQDADGDFEQRHEREVVAA
jgi:SAM-dependent methyltransferase